MVEVDELLDNRKCSSDRDEGTAVTDFVMYGRKLSFQQQALCQRHEKGLHILDLVNSGADVVALLRRYGKTIDVDSFIHIVANALGGLELVVPMWH